ncbi:MAG: hypothetical protein HFE78_02225 [Clostridiales bacterium]|nr:hypothetical protein [Clostridiales bacterium]
MPAYENEIKALLARFEVLLRTQIERSLRIGGQGIWQILPAGDKIKIGLLPGDEDLPGLFAIVDVVLRTLLSDEIQKGTAELINISGLHYESRLTAGKSIPNELLAQIKQCNVIVKGIWREPENGSFASVDAVLQKELALYAKLTSVRLSNRETEWLFFQDLIEGVLPSGGMNIQDLLAIDFVLSTPAGAERLAKTVFSYAKARGIKQILFAVDENSGQRTIENYAAACLLAAKEYDGIELQWMDRASIESTLCRQTEQRAGQIVLLPYKQKEFFLRMQNDLEIYMGQAAIGASWAVFGLDAPSFGSAKPDRTRISVCSGMLQSLALLLDCIGAHHAADRLCSAVCCSLEHRQESDSGDLVSYIEGLLKRIEEM